MFWGHGVTCGCCICNTLPRITKLIFDHSQQPEFIERAGQHLRTCESQLRDEITRFELASVRGHAFASQAGFGKGFVKGAPVFGLPGISTGSAGVAATGVPLLPPVPPPPAVPAAQPERKEERGKGPRTLGPEQTIHTSAKSQPPKPPTKEGAIPVKTEPLEESPTADKEPLAELEPPAEDRHRLKEKDKKKRSKKERTKEKKRRSSSSSQKKRHPRKEPSASPARARSSGVKRKGEEVSPSPPRKERKSRGETRHSSPREERSPEGRRELKPRPPSYPPRGQEKGSSKGRGKGWRGPIPFSSHQRWYAGKNKGVVKRAKQERYNQRKDDRRASR